MWWKQKKKKKVEPPSSREVHPKVEEALWKEGRSGVSKWLRAQSVPPYRAVTPLNEQREHLVPVYLFAHVRRSQAQQSCVFAGR